MSFYCNIFLSFYPILCAKMSSVYKAVNWYTLYGKVSKNGEHFFLIYLKFLMEETVGMIWRTIWQARKWNSIFPPETNFQHELVQEVSKWFNPA